VSGSVLIVDDSLTVRMDLAEAFEAAGLHPVSCSTAAEARAALSRAEVDAVVLDVMLPDADGVEFMQELRGTGSGSTAAVLLLSTEAEVRDRIRGLRTGADEYIGKPYDAEHVVARVWELLRTRGTAATGGTTILVIDDSATFREELRRACEEAGYQVLTAASGDEGMRIVAGQRPAAVVVDGVLPDMDGATVIRRMRLDAAVRGVPCLLLTASEDRLAELRALDAGADAFVRKDEDLAVVLAKLAAILRGAASATPLDQTVSLMGPKKVLAVDDSMTYLSELADSLRGDGYDVVSARSGEEALELLAIQPVDCILLDLLMPGLSGQETCRRIKSAAGVRDVPLIMLTALEDREAMIEALSAGADDYIPKSSEFEVLTARIRAQIRRKQFEEENRRIREELLRKELETAEARAARDLAESRAVLVGELERRNEELEAFSAAVSHDLRSPLGVIDGFTYILLEDYADKLDQEGIDNLRHVRAAARRMGELIEDLLTLSRVGRGELRRDPTSLSEMARTVATELGRKESHRLVTVDIRDGLVAEADGRLIKVALENLLGNAWKFTARIPEATIAFGADQREAHTVYFVRDNGVGFAMGDADKLFRPFSRLHGDEEFPGTGIGLATVHRVIDRHGGRIWAESTPGQGATFYFTLPAPRHAPGHGP
jgi:two-component system, NtrC family, sensor kinase